MKAAPLKRSDHADEKLREAQAAGEARRLEYLATLDERQRNDLDPI